MSNSISNIITSIKNNDPILLKNSLNLNNVNKKIFFIFPDDKIPLWVTLIKISNLKNERYKNLRYDKKKSKMSEDDDCILTQITLDSGADINHQDRNGNTALHYAVYYNNKKLLKLLLSNKIDLNIRNNNGSTALMISTKNENINMMSKLIPKSDLNITDNNGENVFTYYNKNELIIKFPKEMKLNRKIFGN